MDDSGRQISAGTKVVFIIRLKQNGSPLVAPVLQLGDDVAELTHHPAADGVSLFRMAETDDRDSGLFVFDELDRSAFVVVELGLDGVDCDALVAAGGSMAVDCKGRFQMRIFDQTFFE